MKRLIHDWWLGFQLLVRLVIACVCMAVGGGMLMELPLALSALHLRVPVYVYLSLDVLYVVLFCPLLLVSYARYCGIGPRTSETQAVQPCKGAM